MSFQYPLWIDEDAVVGKEEEVIVSTPAPTSKKGSKPKSNGMKNFILLSNSCLC